jgi:hypothetical protein
MSESTNAERAERARNALAAYIDNLPRERARLEELDIACLIDLIADSMHLFGHEAVTNAFNVATIHHNAELIEDEESE